jgi:hypothetical protein
MGRCISQPPSNLTPPQNIDQKEDVCRPHRVMEVTKFVVSGRDKAKLYGDYATYRTQLSNRIHNLRTKLGIATKPRAKYSSKGPVTAEDIASNHE